PGWARYLETGVPWIAAGPLPTSVGCGGDATFTAVLADGYAFQNASQQTWRRDGAPLASGTTATGSMVLVFPGTTRTSVEIARASSADEGTYDCIVANACGSSISNAATLSIGGGSGDGDGNGDGFADGEDVQGFVTMVITGVSQGRGICA